MWALILYDWWPNNKRLGCKKKKNVEEKPREEIHSKNTIIYKPRWETQKKTALQTPWSWTPSLQNCEKIYFCSLSHQSVELCYGSPRELIQTYSKNSYYLLYIMISTLYILFYLILWTSLWSSTVITSLYIVGNRSLSEFKTKAFHHYSPLFYICLLYTSDAADE